MPKLKVVRIEPASKCNLACSHCPTGTVEMTRDIMSDIIFEKVLENLSKYKDEVENAKKSLRIKWMNLSPHMQWSGHI